MSDAKNQRQNWVLKKIKIPDLNKDSLYDDLSSEFEVEKNKLHKEIERYNQFVDKILIQLEKKTNNPFQEIEKIDHKNYEINGLIQKCNNIINQHNKKNMNFNEQQLNEKKDIEEHFLSESYEEYQEFDNEISILDKFVKDLKTKISKTDNEISQLSPEKRDYKKTVEEINKNLKQFLYREELMFEAVENGGKGYYITRNSSGEFAKSLSEGEKTAVALVYFLSKLKEENFDLSKGIIVIDDPISSLDSNSIFQAFGFIKSNIRKTSQVFILTHSFDFFKHIKHWFKRDYKCNAEFFMIKNFYEQEKRMAKISPLDEMLRKYNSEYQYLFKKLLHTSKNMDSLEEVYPLPNVARKFMETFLPFKFPEETNHDEFFSRAREEANFDSGKIEKIKRFINAHSHADIDGMTSWDISRWSESKEIIQDILGLVENLDENHYKGLCKASSVKVTT